MFRRLASCLLLLFGIGGYGHSVFAQVAASAETMPKAMQESRPATTPRDYLAERRALAARADYRPYPLMLLERALLDEHFKRFNDEKYSIAEANEPLKKLIDAYPLGIASNLAIANFLEHVADHIEGSPPDQELLEVADRYRATAQGVIDSILSTGNGESPGTAWEVISVNEEYSILEYLELEPESQALVSVDDRTYDLITAEAKDGRERKVYFDITLFYGKSDD